MPQYLTIGYGDRAGYDSTPKALRDAAHEKDPLLVARGAVIGIAGAPVHVRNAEASGVQTVNAPFLVADLPVAGFALIEAESLRQRLQRSPGRPAPSPMGWWKSGLFCRPTLRRKAND